MNDDPGQRQLLQAAAAGDSRARDRVLQDHVDLVHEAVRERQRRSLDADELEQEGTVALLEAIDSFGSSGEQGFRPYARARIEFRIDAALEEEDAAIERAAGLVRAADQYERGEQAVKRKLGRPGTDEEIARHLRWDVDRTREIRALVEEARRRHDEEILPFLDAEADSDSPPSGNGKLA
jgi:DNA-directed RNA polymerase specialized sigma subunit